MPQAATEWTAAMVRDLPDDGRRYETVDGELLVTPAPSWPHQRAVGGLYNRLPAYLTEYAVADVLIAPADVELDARTLVQPDLFVVPLVQGRKPASYQRQGVPEYWIVDLDARLVERWRPADERPEIVTGLLEWQPVTESPPLAIALDAFFAGVHGA